MTEPKGGFSISGSTVSGVNINQGDNNRVVQGDCSHAVLGDHNQVQQIQGEAAASLSQGDIVALLARIEQMIGEADLPDETKDEAATYAKAAKKATEKETPKKETILTNLKSMGETLTEAGNTVDAAKTLWQRVLPMALKVGQWLGVAALFG
ncbi:MAG: hypothetical protein AAF152_02300 [Cyanobacteria bacterium P01_A01_bin.114]